MTHREIPPQNLFPIMGHMIPAIRYAHKSNGNHQQKKLSGQKLCVKKSDSKGNFYQKGGKKKKQSYYQNTFRRFNGMMKQTERDMLQKYILMHCLEWIFQEAKTITSMQP